VLDGQRRGLRLKESLGREDHINAKDTSSLGILRKVAQIRRSNLMKTFQNSLLIRRTSYSRPTRRKKTEPAINSENMPSPKKGR